LKRQSVEGLVNLFEDWRTSRNTFEQDVAIEIRATGQGFVKSYIDFLKRAMSGDFDVFLDAPINSLVVQKLLYCLPQESPPEEKLEHVCRFFLSDYFANVPYEWIASKVFATLKDMVKQGAFPNREAALGRLNGFFYDTEHIATYAPYCDAFVMDKPMAALVGDSRIGLESKFGVKVFSLNNWDEFLAWLDAIESTMTDEHKKGLSAAYPWISV
jgi:hypothetical protein